MGGPDQGALTGEDRGRLGRRARYRRPAKIGGLLPPVQGTVVRRDEESSRLRERQAAGSKPTPFILPHAIPCRRLSAYRAESCHGQLDEHTTTTLSIQIGTFQITMLE